jgi:hypothetical protein
MEVNMAIRIRVYPSYANPLNGGLGGYGRLGAVSASTLYNQKLQSMQQVSNLRLGYERALWNERLERVRLEERMKNPYAMLGQGGFGFHPLATPFSGNAMLGGRGFFSSLGLGGWF